MSSNNRWRTGNSEHLDDLDVKIIHALKKNSRQNVTQLAKNNGISRPTVYKHLDELFKENLIEIDVSLNIRKLGFNTACLGLEVKSREGKRKLLETLEKCPRVLMLTCNSAKANVSVHVFGEDIETLRSTIESLRELNNSEIVYMFHSEPQSIPKTFRLNIYPEKLEVAPCGLDCAQCVNYNHNLCLGCPATKKYRGYL